VDRWELAREIDNRAQKKGVVVDVLVQVNISGEETKAGMEPQSLRAFLESSRELTALRVKGLMTVAPYTADPESVRPVFRTLRELRDELREEYPLVTELSMGMSGDYAVAIGEGATLVRVGSALFGARDYR